MKKNFLIGLIGLSALSLISCGESDISSNDNDSRLEDSSSISDSSSTQNHEHSYSNEWATNETKHWHASTCGHDVVSDEAEHTFGEWKVVIAVTEESTGSKSRSCTVCGYKQTEEIAKLSHTHKYDTTTWTYDDAKHWHASTCGHDVVSDEAEHSYGEDNSCTICGYKDNLIYRLSDDGTSYSVRGCSEVTGKIVIPSNYNGKPVTKIDDYAFFNCSNLTSIVIPDSITSICDKAFSGCVSLQYNEYDNGYYLGNNNNPYVVLVKVKRRDITSFEVNENCKFIYGRAFNQCYSLTSVVIPNSVTTIGDYAFYNCYGLVEVINKSSLAITKGSYDNGYVGYYALNVIKDGESEIVNVNDYLFYTVDGTNYLVGYIGKETSLVLPDNYNGESYVINQYAFASLENITSIVIPNSVTSIGYDAFDNCSSLTSIYYKGTASEWYNIYIDSFVSSYLTTKYYYSEIEPTDTSYNYWHYVDGVPTKW